ncbi:hypothetical protein [Snodgrassella sp. CS2]|uniref:hypothetical protein n=1 Tax=Snodgrassella sp. CS2 TaxID=3418953 RepID=UPI003D08AFA8
MLLLVCVCKLGQKPIRYGADASWLYAAYMKIDYRKFLLRCFVCSDGGSEAVLVDEDCIWWWISFGLCRLIWLLFFACCCFGYSGCRYFLCQLMCVNKAEVVAFCWLKTIAI